MEPLPSHETFLERTRRLIAEEIAPRASEADANERFDPSFFKKLGEHGLLGVPFEEEHGGANLGFAFFYSRVLREVASACASTASGMLAHTGLTARLIHRFGNEQQKAHYLRPLATGESLGAFALTEPNAGSDMAAVELVAEPRDDAYVLSGSKIFITNASFADVFVVVARTTANNPAMGMSLFIVEKDTPGLTTSREPSGKLGMRASDTATLSFDAVTVPASNLLGRKGMGLAMANHALAGSRVGMAAIALGIAEAAYERCVERARTREQFGRPLHQFQSVGNMLADMATGLSAGNLLLSKAVDGMDRGKASPLDASIAKLFCAETATRITKDAIQIFGGHGYYRDHPIERYFRDAKLTEIADGASELQRLLIAEDIIKKSAKRARSS